MNSTWEAAIDGWLVSLRAAGAPETSIRTRRQHVSQLANSGLVPDPWKATTADLVGWLGANAHWKAETRYAHRTSLRGLYRWAYGNELVPYDPSLALPKVRRTPPRARALPEPVALAALAAADDREALMIRLAGEYGLRRSEIAVVHSRDIQADLLGYSLLVHGKGGRQRLVPIDKDEIAEAILDADGYAFPGKIDGHLSPWWVGKLVSRLLPHGWTTHTLRHRFATVSYAVDHDVFAVQSVLGHASPATTLRYVQLPDDAGRRLVAASHFKPDIGPQTNRYVVSNLKLKGTA